MPAQGFALVRSAATQNIQGTRARAVSRTYMTMYKSAPLAEILLIILLELKMLKQPIDY